MKEYENAIDAEFEPFDDELKGIMKNRYQDESHLFTPEAQEQRRNNRLMFTLKISAFLIGLCFFCLWANVEGLMSVGKMAGAIAGCAIMIGYNIGVCVCHNKGWRGA